MKKNASVVIVPNKNNVVILGERRRVDERKDREYSGARDTRDNNHTRDNNRDVGRTRPRCNNYDNKGYCLKGDQCPFAHGADRIVVDRPSNPSKHST